MAQQGDQISPRKLCCLICLDLLKDPVTIPCGHSYCMSCIKSHWDKEDQRQIHSCPQCRRTFVPRPALVKNTMLADLVEEQKTTGLQAAPADHYARPEDVGCDFCTGRKRKAVKSCLQCLVSACKQHLQPHYEVVPLKKHKLVDPSKELQENICTRHNEVIKIFCRTDQQCICYLCSLDEHKGHNTVSAAAEMRKKQQQLSVRWQHIPPRIQNREKDVTVLQQELEAINRSADKAVEDSEKMSTELVQLIEKKRTDMKQRIRSQQKSEVSRVKDLQEKLQQEITDLRQGCDQMKKLVQTENYTQFLRSYPSLPNLTNFKESSSIKIHPVRHFEDVTAAVSEAGKKLQDTCNKEWNKISKTVTEVDVLLPQNPQTRAELSQYAVHKNRFELDPNTASMQLVLSKENRKATLMRDEQSYPVHQDRFMSRSQVLCKKSLTGGRQYWEVKWSGLGVSVAVAYKAIARTGDESRFGENDKSWTLDCVKKSMHMTYDFKHNGSKTTITKPLSSRVGVFLDYKAGILSFYSVSETITPIHKVQTTFTEPLYAGLGVCYFGSTAEFWEVKQARVDAGVFPPNNSCLDQQTEGAFAN
ncbi:tripartite motif-containing protein 16-like [Epinephelus moara]|uniref:tripartite motif-containing protein 16-like n=1 Tax=Epinephelus moara TaxID=300413 RepID=UPI00214F0E75|nr:tripartite motif-containing protein 16-like [Epinephelus moara]